MRAPPNLLGYISGQLTVTKFLQSGSWECKCSCGAIRTVNTGDLIRRHRKSCGCSRRGRKAWNSGGKMPPGFSEKLSQRLKGRPSHWRGKKKGPLSFEHRLKISLAHRGEKAYWWGGGKTAQTLLLRASFEYREWRNAVYKRDNYTCVICGDARGGNLEADHIKPFSRFPDLRFEVSNGRTLCQECHRKTPTWGNKAKPWK